MRKALALLSLGLSGCLACADAALAKETVVPVHSFAQAIAARIRERTDVGDLRLGVGPVQVEWDTGNNSPARQMTAIMQDENVESELNGDKIRRELIAALTTQSGITVVDRERLDAVLEEFSLIRRVDINLADPDRIARAGRMVNANFLLFPRVSIERDVLSRDNVAGVEVVRTARLAFECEAEIVDVEESVTIGVAQGAGEWNYGVRNVQAEIVNVRPDVAGEWGPGYEVTVRVSAQHVMGRKLRVGLFAKAGNTYLSTQMNAYANNSGELTKQIVIGPAPHSRYEWITRLQIPYEAFRREAFRDPMDRGQVIYELRGDRPSRPEKSVLFHYEVFVWEVLDGDVGPHVGGCSQERDWEVHFYLD